MRHSVQAARINYQSYRILLAEVVLVFLIPIVALKLVPHLLEIRHQIMWGFIIYVTAVIGWQRITTADLGFATDNFREAVKALRLPTILMVLMMVTTAAIRPELLFIKEAVPLIQESLIKSIATYLIISVTAQEVLFRSFAVARLSLVNRNKLFLLVATSVVFMIAHIPFNNPLFVFGSIGPGIVWTYYYIKNRNVYAVILSHMLVGLAAFLPTLLLIPR